MWEVYIYCSTLAYIRQETHIHLKDKKLYMLQVEYNYPVVYPIGTYAHMTSQCHPGVNNLRMETLICGSRKYILYTCASPYQLWHNYAFINHAGVI